MNKTPQQQASQGTLVDEEQPIDLKGMPERKSETDFSPGNSDTLQQDSEQVTHGQEGYPGARTEGTNQPPGLIPPAGDVDPGSTKSAQETGQDGDTSRDVKKKAFNYNG